VVPKFPDHAKAEYHPNRRMVKHMKANEAGEQILIRHG
jgi:hypothetical protein